MKRRRFIHSIGAGVLLGIYSQSKSIRAAADTVVTSGKGSENLRIGIASPGNLIESDLADNFTFEQFVEGKSNRVAHNAALHILENSCSSCHPVFIYSNAGNGKTHLMHAIGHKVKSDKPNTKVLQIHTQHFITETNRAIQRNTIDEFRAFLQRLDALLIDDIEFLAGKERSQRELSYILGVLMNNQKQIVITGQTTPEEVKGINEPLKFILGSGVAVYMASPDLKTRIEILKRKGRQWNHELSDDVAFFIANSLYACVRELESVLRRVVAHAYFEGKDITVDSTRSVLAELGYIRLDGVV